MKRTLYVMIVLFLLMTLAPQAIAGKIKLEFDLIVKDWHFLEEADGRVKLDISLTGKPHPADVERLKKPVVEYLEGRQEDFESKIEEYHKKILEAMDEDTKENKKLYDKLVKKLNNYYKKKMKHIHRRCEKMIKDKWKEIQKRKNLTGTHTKTAIKKISWTLAGGGFAITATLLSAGISMAASWETVVIPIIAGMAAVFATAGEIAGMVTTTIAIVKKAKKENARVVENYLPGLETSFKNERLLKTNKKNWLIEVRGHLENFATASDNYKAEIGNMEKEYRKTWSAISKHKKRLKTIDTKIHKALKKVNKYAKKGRVSASKMRKINKMINKIEDLKKIQVAAKENIGKITEEMEKMEDTIEKKIEISEKYDLYQQKVAKEIKSMELIKLKQLLQITDETAEAAQKGMELCGHFVAVAQSCAELLIELSKVAKAVK